MKYSQDTLKDAFVIQKAPIDVYTTEKGKHQRFVLKRYATPLERRFLFIGNLFKKTDLMEGEPLSGLLTL